MPALSWALFLGFAEPGSVPLDSVFRVRNAAGMSDVETMGALRRAVSEAVVLRRDTVFTNSTTIDKSWVNAVLYQHTFSNDNNNKVSNHSTLDLDADVKITCATCYTKGNVTARLSITGDFNATEALQNVTAQFKNEILNITKVVEDDAKAVISDIGELLSKGDFNIEDIPFPTLDFGFNMDIGGIPEVSLSFQFDGMELYMELDMSLSLGATYTLNLYTSDTPIGIAVSNDLELGIVFKIDLILDIEGEIDISSGFHLKLDDGVKIDIEMFSNKVSSVVFPGGRFEFLPVTVSTPSATIKAVLRVAIHTGIAYQTPSLTIDGHDFSLGAGVDGSVFANVAEFVTNVTADESGSSCKLPVVEYYELAVGAAAGATINAGTHVWGPMPNTTVPIFYTTLKEACARSSSTPTTATPTVTARAAAVAGLEARKASLTTTTITTNVVYTGQACLLSGVINCPVSEQTTTTYQTKLTLVTAVPSGVTASFPATTLASVPSTVPFGPNAKSIVSSSGTPTSFGPSATGSFLNGNTHGVSNKVILGVSIGIGVPVLIAIITACCCFCRHRRHTVPNPQTTNVYVAQPLQQYTPGSYAPSTFTASPYTPAKEGFGVTVARSR